MILTCPACGTQYVVKDGMIPPGGRQVRCASCKHSWHQDPEPAETVHDDEDESLTEAAMIEPRSGVEAEQQAYAASQVAADEVASSGEVDNISAEAGYADEPAADATGFEAPDRGEPFVEDLATAAAYDEGVGSTAPEEPVLAEPEPEPVSPDDDWSAQSDQSDSDFSPFAVRGEDEPRRRGRVGPILIAVLLIAVMAAAFWFLAPAEWKARLGIADAADTPLQLMMTHSERSQLESGEESLAITGRVINPTGKNQMVPPIRAQLRSASGQIVHSWTISPPARSLPPGASKTFYSTEVNVPAGGDDLVITLGEPNA